MKYSNLFLVLFFLGCSEPKSNEVDFQNQTKAIDSMIEQSRINLLVMDSTSKTTDSTITGKVEKTVKQITTLKEENTKLKKENELLKDKLDDISNNGKPFELLPVSNGKGNR